MLDYTKGSALKRFFTFAWRRHHVERVEGFLQMYNDGRCPDDLTINAIFQIIYGTEDHINESSNIKGLLIRYIKFCAKLNNEMTATSSLVAETTQERDNAANTDGTGAIAVAKSYTPLTDEPVLQESQAIAASAVAATAVPPSLLEPSTNSAAALASSEPRTISDESLEKDLVASVVSSDKSNITSDDKGTAKFFKASSQESLKESPKISPAPSLS